MTERQRNQLMFLANVIASKTDQAGWSVADVITLARLQLELIEAEAKRNAVVTRRATA